MDDITDAQLIAYAKKLGLKKRFFESMTSFKKRVESVFWKRVVNVLKHPKINSYKEKFIKHFTDLGIGEDIANDECDVWIDMMDLDDLDFEHPEFDASECLSYWGE